MIWNPGLNRESRERLLHEFAFSPDDVLVCHSVDRFMPSWWLRDWSPRWVCTNYRCVLFEHPFAFATSDRVCRHCGQPTRPAAGGIVQLYEHDSGPGIVAEPVWTGSELLADLEPPAGARAEDLRLMYEPHVLVGMTFGQRFTELWNVSRRPNEVDLERLGVSPERWNAHRRLRQQFEWGKPRPIEKKQPDFHVVRTPSEPGRRRGERVREATGSQFELVQRDDDSGVLRSEFHRLFKITTTRNFYLAHQWGRRTKQGWRTWQRIEACVNADAAQRRSNYVVATQFNYPFEHRVTRPLPITRFVPDAATIKQLGTLLIDPYLAELTKRLPEPSGPCVVVMMHGWDLEQAAGFRATVLEPVLSSYPNAAEYAPNQDIEVRLWALPESIARTLKELTETERGLRLLVSIVGPYPDDPSDMDRTRNVLAATLRLAEHENGGYYYIDNVRHALHNAQLAGP